MEDFTNLYGDEAIWEDDLNLTSEEMLSVDADTWLEATKDSTEMPKFGLPDSLGRFCVGTMCRW